MALDDPLQGRLQDPLLATPNAPDGPVRLARSLTLAAVIGLVLNGLAWELWLAPTGHGTWAIKVLPLVLCLGGLLRHRLYTYRWLSLLVWLYFLEAVVRATTEAGLSQALALVQLLLCLLLFGASGLYVRWRLRNGRRLASPADGASP
jgi:uncharacterized membrane protein